MQLFIFSSYQAFFFTSEKKARTWYPIGLNASLRGTQEKVKSLKLTQHHFDTLCLTLVLYAQELVSR